VNKEAVMPPFFISCSWLAHPDLGRDGRGVRVGSPRPRRIRRQSSLLFLLWVFLPRSFQPNQALQFPKALYFASLFNQQPSTNNHQLIIQLASASRLGSGWSCVRVGSPRPRRIRRQSSLLFSFPAVD